MKDQNGIQDDGAVTKTVFTPHLRVAIMALLLPTPNLGYQEQKMVVTIDLLFQGLLMIIQGTHMNTKIMVKLTDLHNFRQ